MAICKNCRCEYEKKTGNQKYCSGKCRNQYWARKYYYENQEKCKATARGRRKRANELNKSDHRRKQKRDYMRKRRKTNVRYKLIVCVRDRLRRTFFRECNILNNRKCLMFPEIDER